MTSEDEARNERSRRGSYHHGNLRDALIDIAIDLITRDGVATFSIAEACRRLDVSPGAPYRHFSDREDLLTAIAVRACETLVGHIRMVVGNETDPVERLVRAARANVEFAALYPALFEVMYTKEVFVGGNARLIEPVRPVVEAFLTPAFEIPGVTAAQATSLAVSAAAVAHGYASFLPAGTFSDAPDSLAIAADNAACATRALIMGRAALASSPGEPGIALAGLPIQTWFDVIADNAGKEITK
ncbi:TetR/AcrR family transcriptional regulator [Mycolicibacterium vanbaalenii PYR-1]|uniref:Transcriptional regulator, TetR family n=1 Tax=Mycolicibacterium vanbaalenii (strain DSM 7251 / JCM 13017 / BCRC 16820 / KCTC 9966 / NRRL B-24157 / PYR-1) TaxID=350058 RepID=A1T3I3_MYCVP|nr:transcriptional regulator, TetR family [Mycolicibacterium vanbaalenii PYR-1]MCV7127853.1 TetR/AcrR family transcriptional regulator [Mycolicibacterium vanbaalenii PYR-1]